MESDAWFAGLDRGMAAEAGADRIQEGETPAPQDWPAQAVESGFVADETEYYAALHEATLAATRAAVTERERADDKQLAHAVRAMDDVTESANELAERVSEWAGSLFGEIGTGIEDARTVADREPAGPAEARVVSLAEQVDALATERDELESFIQRQAPDVAPNLSAIAGPVLTARLIALAGDLESLAKMPSGTVQVLGAEQALFAHLAGRAPSPKHGVIYVHEYVRGTRPEDRGSAARALAGKLAIAARIDHYSGDYRPQLKQELDERMETIRARAEEDNE